MPPSLPNPLFCVYESPCYKKALLHAKLKQG